MYIHVYFLITILIIALHNNAAIVLSALSLVGEIKIVGKFFPIFPHY